MIHKSFLASHIIVLNLVRGFLFFVCLLSHDCLLNICILCFSFYSIRKIDDEECSWKRRPTIAISFNIFFSALFIYHVIALPRSYHGSRQTPPAMTQHVLKPQLCFLSLFTTFNYFKAFKKWEIDRFAQLHFSSIKSFPQLFQYFSLIFYIFSYLLTNQRNTFLWLSVSD